MSMISGCVGLVVRDASLKPFFYTLAFFQSVKGTEESAWMS